ncbi:hypothetical protein SAMN04487995_4582 [Dyadobacter koreensis]|uniref:Uncharacterized protein n=1 Tax=Dyadobacter koreensis TaxID=408657 RepID=A0A1H6YK09_9BACT|nr:hypothetical protein [Dyadobacter koreensis]SEJ41658.1 hypothetical protein SAMN04487995_4582 [Dyadobacter koreensis]
MPGQETNLPKTEEEILLDKEVANAEKKKQLAQFLFEAAESKKKLLDLDNPLTKQQFATANESIAASNLKALQSARDRWKGPDVKAVDGKITSEGNSIENHLLAGKALYDCFDKLIKIIDNQPFSKNKNLNLIIYNSADFPQIDLYKGMLDQIESIKQLFIETFKTFDSTIFDKEDLSGGTFDPLLLGFAAGGIIRTVADIFSFFKISTDINNYDITLDETALIATFSKVVRIEKPDWSVFYPAAYPVNIANDSSSKRNNFTNLLIELKELDEKAKLNIQSLDEKLTTFQSDLSTETEIKKVENIKSKVLKITELKQNLQKITATYNQFDTLLSTTTAGNNMSILTTILRAEKIVQKFIEDDSYVIKLSAYSNGSTRKINGTFRASSIEFSGGSEVHCIIFNKDGSVLFSENVYEYIPYKKSENILQIVSL